MVESSVLKSMENAAILTLAGFCLGIALTGLFAVVLRKGGDRERLCLGIVYFTFIGLIALPLVTTFAEFALLDYMPALLVMLLALPPAFYHYILVKTASPAASHFPWRDTAMPIAGTVVCFGFWILPAQAKEVMFISGDLPPGLLPAVLALLTFALLTLWLLASFAYLVGTLRHLTAFRAHNRQLYSDAEERDMRWVNVVIAVLVLIWATGAISLASENYSDGSMFAEELFLALIAGGLLVMNVFAPIGTPEEVSSDDEDGPDIKYARSALSSDYAAKLAERLETAMRNEKIYLDPSLSLQKLSRHIGARPNQVSQTLNQEIGANFFDYVSRWRIEASKPLITAGDASVLDVALEVGFNSRSAFYNAFKRETGMTPKGYRGLQRGAG